MLSGNSFLNKTDSFKFEKGNIIEDNMYVSMSINIDYNIFYLK